MQRAVNRFWDWLFHPAIRSYKTPNDIATTFRYPSPGNAPFQPVHPLKQYDYKTPYEHTLYNIRYAESTPMQMAEKRQEMKVAPLCNNAILKLKKVGLLKPGEEKNVDAVAAAKAKFQQKYGFSADQQVYKNEGDYNLLQSTNREQISAYIQNFYQGVRDVKEDTLDPNMIRSTIDDPEMVPLESVDLFTSPSFQQSKISNEYLIDKMANDTARKKQIDSYVGDARFWKAIDDSFSTHEVEKVQKHIGDQDPKAFELRTSSKIDLEFDKEGHVIDVHPKH